MAKTAAKKRPPARAKAAARSAPAKTRIPVKKPLTKAGNAKVRAASKPVKRPASRVVAKKTTKSPVSRKVVTGAKASKPAVRSKSANKPALKKTAAQKPVITVAKALVKKVITLAKPVVKAVAAAAPPKLNGNSKNGIAKRPAAPASVARSSLSSPATPKASVARPEPVLVPDSRVATNLKPRKNQAGLGVKELENFRALLLEKRREILGDMRSMENEALGSNGNGVSASPVNLTDMGTDNYEQEFTLGLVEKDRMLLREINNALAKIQNGAYGICEGNGTAIGKPRLEVQPWARYSIEFARIRERNGMGIR